MESPIVRPRLSQRIPLAPLGILAVGGLLSIPVLFTYLQAALLHRVEMPLPIFSVIAAVLAALVAGYPLGGWRWTPLLATFWCSLMIGGNFDHIVSDLQRPRDTHLFSFVVVLLATMLVGAVSGVAATVENYRGASRRAPRGLVPALGMLAALVVGTILTAAIPQPVSQASVSADVLMTLPSVVARQAVFEQTQLHAKVGETVALRLDNHDGVGHSFDIDELNVHAAMPSATPGLALFKPDKPGTYIFYCAIPGHADKASGTGMLGTLVVTR